MNNKDNVKRKVSASELEQLNNKFPQMAQNFEALKKQVYEPQIQGLGQTKGQQD